MSIAWLRDLEERVGQAGEQLHALRGENQTLRQQVADLEEQLAATGQADEEAERWQGERDEIKERVGSLVSKLETLLEDAD